MRVYETSEARDIAPRTRCETRATARRYARSASRAKLDYASRGGPIARGSAEGVWDRRGEQTYLPRKNLGDAPGSSGTDILCDAVFCFVGHCGIGFVPRPRQRRGTPPRSFPQLLADQDWVRRTGEGLSEGAGTSCHASGGGLLSGVLNLMGWETGHMPCRGGRTY